VNAHNSGSRLQAEKRKPIRRNALGGQDEGEPKGPSRIGVRIISLRTRLLDQDNLTRGCKGLLDGLRYARAIPDDSPDFIDLEVEQVKVDKAREKTVIVLTYP